MNIVNLLTYNIDYENYILVNVYSLDLCRFILLHKVHINSFISIFNITDWSVTLIFIDCNS